jgi:hypothetical protein
MHVPSHAVSQQKPSAQKPLLQSEAHAQDSPLVLFRAPAVVHDPVPPPPPPALSDGVPLSPGFCEGDDLHPTAVVAVAISSAATAKRQPRA